MIEKIEIKNFKSIRDLQFPAKRINLFIGEPNGGKSNILEALSFFSPNSLDLNFFKNVFRFTTISDLFFDSGINKPIEIKTGFMNLKIMFLKKKTGVLHNEFYMCFYNEDPGVETIEDTLSNPKIIASLSINHEGSIDKVQGSFNSIFRTYSYNRLKAFKPAYQNFLNPPFGDNIPVLLLGNAELKKMISDLFREKGFKIQIKPIENEIYISKEVEDELYSYPYHTISETLQRIVFMMLAIESNENAVLILDEPEANTFPFYTKYIAERIALDLKNQYFITTHNPYLLNNIIEKAPLTDLNLFVVEMKNYETKLTALKKEQVAGALEMGSDFFFNLDDIIKK